jgi:rubrerythrin
MSEQEEEIKPSTTKWKCPECGQKLTLYITPSTPPTCANPESHPKKTVKMVGK